MDLVLSRHATHSVLMLREKLPERETDPIGLRRSVTFFPQLRMRLVTLNYSGAILLYGSFSAQLKAASD